MRPHAVLVVLLVTVAVDGQVFDYDLYERVLDEAECDRQLNYLTINDPITFLDASGKIPAGISGGNLHELGDYFLCLGISELAEDMHIQGKWCSVTAPLDQLGLQIDTDINKLQIERSSRNNIAQVLQFGESYPKESNVNDIVPFVDNRAIPSLTAATGLTLGVCVPRVCSPRQAADFLLSNLGRNITLHEGFCRLPGDKPFVAADYVAVALLAVLAAVTLASTSYDVHHIVLKKRPPSSARALFRSFSLYTNTRRVLTVRAAAPGALECVDGIRAISMLWVVVGHTFALTLSMPVQNIYTALEWSRSASSIWLVSATASVDTFFTLSGILCVYSIIGKVSRWQFIKSIPLFYIHRLLRMFPLLAAVVLLQASLLHHWADGPQWTIMAWAVQNCRSYWWSALLHIQNFTNVNEICVGQTWYLSVDVQLYLLCPLVLVWLCRPRAPPASAAATATPRAAPRLPTAVLSVAVAASLVAVSAYSFTNNWPANMMNFKRMKSMSTYMKKYYMNTLSRASPFCVGMVFGYLLHIWRDQRLVMRRLVHLPLWLASLAAMSLIVYSVHPTAQSGPESQALDNSLNSYSRAVWATAVGWLVLACVQGYGGPIDWFLSLRVWKVPARLSYAMYLVHYPLIFLANSAAVTTHYFTVGESLYRFFSDASLALLAALLLCVAVDAPASALQGMLFARLGLDGKSRKKTESQESVAVEDSKANI